MVDYDTDSDYNFSCRSGTRGHTGNSITIGSSDTLQGLSMGLITGLQCDPGNAPRRLADPRKIHIKHPDRKARKPQAPRAMNFIRNQHTGREDTNMYSFTGNITGLSRITALVCSLLPNFLLRPPD